MAINILFFSSCFSVIMISLPRLRTVSVISLCVLGVLTVLNIVVFLETGNSVKKGKVKFLSDMHDCRKIPRHMY